jgi:4-amino-4-deoxy-L-arabinose transferase-like glycosyltransferase
VGALSISHKHALGLLSLLILAWLGSSWWARIHFLPYDVNNTDISTYLFQAQTFVDSGLYRQTPQLREFFQQWQAIVKDRSYAYYPPGHALLLAIPLAFKMNPWFLTWILSGASLFLFYFWAKEIIGVEGSLLGVSVMACSPFFASNASSLLSHSSTLFVTLLFLWSALRWRVTQRIHFAFLCGIFLAWIFATRSVNAVALGLSWIPWIFWAHRPSIKVECRKTWYPWISFLTGASLITIPLLIYYRILGGRWCLDLFTDYWPRNQFGFGKGLGRGEPGHFFQTYADHDFKGMFRIWKYSLNGLLQWWTGIPGWKNGSSGEVQSWVNWFFIAVFLIFIGVAVVVLLEKKNIFSKDKEITNIVWPLLFWPVIHIVLYSFYFTPSTAFSGPRYLSELIPFLAIASGLFLVAFLSRRETHWVLKIFFSMVIVCGVLFKVGFYRSNQNGIAARRQVEDCVREAKPPALVFIRSFWLGHPFPIFLNRPDLSDPIIFACDRGVEDKRLIASYRKRNAYILCVTPLANGEIKTELVQVYDAARGLGLIEPQEISAPFFVGGGFSKPLQLKGQKARVLFYPKPEEIFSQ